MPSIFKNLQTPQTEPEIIEDGFVLGNPTPTTQEPIEQQEASAGQIDTNLKNGVVLTNVSQEYSKQSLENLETLAAAARTYLEENADVVQKVATAIAGLGQIAVLSSTFSVSAQKEINRLNEVLNRYKEQFGTFDAGVVPAPAVQEPASPDEPIVFAPELTKQEETSKVKVLLPSQVASRLLKVIQDKFPKDRHTDYGVSTSSPDYDANVVAVIKQNALAHVSDICSHITKRADKEGMFFVNNVTDGDFGLVVYSESILLIIPNLLNVHQHMFVNIATGEAIKMKTETQLETIENVIKQA